MECDDSGRNNVKLNEVLPAVRYIYFQVKVLVLSSQTKHWPNPHGIKTVGIFYLEFRQLKNQFQTVGPIYGVRIFLGWERQKQFSPKLAGHLRFPTRYSQPVNRGDFYRKRISYGKHTQNKLHQVAVCIVV